MDVKTLVTVPIAVGELIDKITILENKAKRPLSPTQLEAVNTELEALKQVAWETLQSSDELVALHDRLLQINTFLWDLEDEVRQSVDTGSHSKAVALITRIHRKNDERARVKKKLNELYNSTIVEAKKYATQDEV